MIPSSGRDCWPFPCRLPTHACLTVQGEDDDSVTASREDLKPRLRTGRVSRCKKQPDDHVLLQSQRTHRNCGSLTARTPVSCSSSLTPTGIICGAGIPGWINCIRRTRFEKAIAIWQQQFANNLGFLRRHRIWFKGRFCGMISHINLDWTNRWTALSYWLDEAHQGQGDHDGLLPGGDRAQLQDVEAQSHHHRVRDGKCPQPRHSRTAGIQAGRNRARD